MRSHPEHVIDITLSQPDFTDVCIYVSPLVRAINRLRQALDLVASGANDATDEAVPLANTKLAAQPPAQVWVQLRSLAGDSRRSVCSKYHRGS
jgi:hypothetical protein